MVPQRLGRLAQLARRTGLIASPLARQPIRIGLELLHLGVERVFLGAECPLACRAIGSSGGLHAAHVFRDLLLPLLQPLRLLGEPLHVARDPLIARVLDPARRAIQFLQRRVALRLRAAGGLPHLVGRALQLLSGLCELLRLLLARESLEPARLLLRLPRKFALRAATSTARLPAHAIAHRFGLALHPFILLLLPRGKLLEPLERLVDFLRLSGRRLLLDGFVLIALPVVLELEEIGEVLGALSAAPAATPALLLAALHLHVAVQRVGALELAQRPLLARKRSASVAHAELLLRALHLLLGRDERPVDLREHRVLLGDPALEQVLRQRRDLLAEAALRDRERRRVLIALALCVLDAVAQPVVGARDDVALTLGQLARIFAAATASTTTAARLGLAIVARPRAHLEEVHIAERLVAGRVACHGVVRDEIAGFETHLLEQQRMRGLRLGGGLCERRKRDGALLAAIHAVAKLERRDAVVVTRLGLDRDLLERGDLGVAAWIGDAHVGRAIVEHLDRVLHAADDATAIGGLEIDAIEAALA